MLKYHTTAWQAFEGKRDSRQEKCEGGGGMGSEGGRGLQGGRYFHVINIHQTIVKILIGQFSKHVNYGRYLIRLVEINITAVISVII